MSCPCHVLVFTWWLCVSDLLLDQLFLPRANDGTTPRACLTLWTYIYIWSMVHGPLSIVHGPLSMVHDQWSIFGFLKHGMFDARSVTFIRITDLVQFSGTKMKLIYTTGGVVPMIPAVIYRQPL
jgi:hypothetical protein